MTAFDWFLYLKVSDDLMSFGSEAHYRSAISRAYYGVFIAIRDALDKKGIQLLQKDIHAFVTNWLKQQPVSHFRQMGNNLSRLRRERNHADYDTYEVFSLERGEKSLIMARQIESSARLHL